MKIELENCRRSKKEAVSKNYEGHENTRKTCEIYRNDGDKFSNSRKKIEQHLERSISRRQQEIEDTSMEP